MRNTSSTFWQTRETGTRGLISRTQVDAVVLVARAHRRRRDGQADVRRDPRVARRHAAVPQRRRQVRRLRGRVAARITIPSTGVAAPPRRRRGYSVDHILGPARRGYSADGSRFPVRPAQASSPKTSTPTRICCETGAAARPRWRTSRCERPTAARRPRRPRSSGRRGGRSGTRPPRYLWRSRRRTVFEDRSWRSSFRGTRGSLWFFAGRTPDLATCFLSCSRSPC